ncbi:hypothetical protein M0804_013696 [Polistes exclamans]|nr:hypothetical protein M0804_013696 [Polistes exclamans]
MGYRYGCYRPAPVRDTTSPPTQTQMQTQTPTPIYPAPVYHQQQRLSPLTNTNGTSNFMKPIPQDTLVDSFQPPKKRSTFRGLIFLLLLLRYCCF